MAIWNDSDNSCRQTKRNDRQNQTAIAAGLEEASAQYGRPFKFHLAMLLSSCDYWIAPVQSCTLRIEIGTELVARLSS